MIFDDARTRFSWATGIRWGLSGSTAPGKTTLFKVLLGMQELDGGTIDLGRSRVGYLPQEIEADFGDETAFQYLEAGRPIGQLNAELEAVTGQLGETEDPDEQQALLDRMDEVNRQLDYFDQFEAEDILLELIDRMQIDPDLLDRKMDEMSGGQKSKLAFARLLYSKPEVLLLDEPTNHLDASTRGFVTSYLKNYRGNVLIISHDVDFLNAVVDKILLVNKVTHKISVYDGNYDTYKIKYAAEQRAKEQLRSRQEKEIKQLSDFVQRAKQASQTNHALKRMGLERAARLEKKKKELVEKERTYRRVKMNITPSRESGPVPLEVEKVSFRYDGQPELYHELSFSLNRGERFLVVGENGAGKSTLLKLMAGLLTPERGRVRLNPKTDIAYYAQELEGLDPDKTVLENVDTDGYTPWQLRSILGNFLFYDEDVNKKLAVLSPGEKARVTLCKILLQKANLLLLDEPTNHLDPETQRVIGGNFREYKGTLVAVSHNPSFVEQIGISRMLVLPSGRIENYSRELLSYYYRLNTPEEEWYAEEL